MTLATVVAVLTAPHWVIRISKKRSGWNRTSLIIANVPINAHEKPQEGVPAGRESESGQRVPADRSPLSGGPGPLDSQPFRGPQARRRRFPAGPERRRRLRVGRRLQR